MMETMTLFSTLTDEKLEKIHLSKVLPRYTKKGDAKTQFYAKRILSNAASGTKNKAADPVAKKAVTKDTSAPSPIAKRAEPESVAGVKRPASATGEGGAQKKIATGVPRTNATLATTKQNGVAKKPTPSTDNTKSTTTTASKPKQVVAKPSGLFSSLQSAAKKPGTSNANKVGQSGTTTVAAKPTERPSTTSAPSTAPKSTFSFAETMANLSKPKEEKPAAKQEKPAPPETPEEKAKRLRKESRRLLHVSFKDEDLVQIRTFEHFPEEDLGHDASQMRDVSDVGGEGRMFKQQHQMMDIDDDEEETPGEEEKLIDFVQPVEIDFSNVDEEERNRNYAPFGGGKLEPKSAERAVRDHYEANNLIVFYANASDIPPNPREPTDPNNGEPVGTVKKFGQPEAKWAARAQQKQGAQYHGVTQAPTAAATNATQGFDLSKLTNMMQYQQPNAYQPPQQPAPPTNNDLSNILATLKQATTNQATPPPHPSMGAYGNAFAAAAPNMNAMQTQPPSTQPGGQPDLAAILAQLTQNQSNAAQAPPMASYGYNAPGSVPNMMGYTPQAQAQQGPVYENPERKQWREGQGDSALGKKPRQGPNPYYKTKVCKYWEEGRCQKGDSCTYKHEKA